MEAANDTTVVTVFPLIAVLFGITFYRYWTTDNYFKLLAERHAKYYEKNGRPLYFGSLYRSIRATRYMTSLLFHGIPKDLPKDAEARQLVRRLRHLSVVPPLCVVAIIAVAEYYF